MGRISESDLVDSGQLAIIGRENTGLDDVNTLYGPLPNSDFKIFAYFERDQIDAAIAKLQAVKIELEDMPIIDETDEVILIVNTGNPTITFSEALRDSLITDFKAWVLTTRNAKETEYNDKSNDIKTKVLTLADATGFTVSNTINQTTGDAASGEIKSINGNDVTVFTQTELVFAVGETVQEGANTSTINSIE